MNIKQALKYKNKLVSKMNGEFDKASTYNSVEVGTVKPYSADNALSFYFELSNELVELKTKIHLANNKVYDKIFLLSELKSRAAKLKHLDCSEGKVSSSRFGRLSGEDPIIKEAEIGVVKRDEILFNIETKIEEIQEELDIHNAITEI